MNGNFTLRSAIANHECEIKKSFNDFRLVFPTKKAARKALWEGFKELRSKYPEEVGGISGINYAKRSLLTYDSSVARIVEN